MKPIFWTIKVPWWPWKLGQSHQIPFCKADPPNYAKNQTWPESIQWFWGYCSKTHFLNNQSSMLGQCQQIPFCNKDSPNYAKIPNITRIHLGKSQWNPFSEQSKFRGDLENYVKFTKFLSAMQTLLIIVNTKHDQNSSSGPGDIAVRPILWTIKVPWSPWKLGQIHQIPFCNGDPRNCAKY